ncbi:MAG: zinc-ribbon domain-containing protein, partial [Chloroflexota bacterium]|nr:zinc-ribbon domain-containing protein [Chloroflexota bacterium]
MICPTCGADNRTGAGFCAKCGAPLKNAPAPPQPSGSPTGSPADPVQ